MSLRDRFRIDELTNVGSKSITRDKDGGITLRRVNKTETKPEKPTDKPFGTEPIKTKQVNPRLKSDIVNPQRENNQEQTSFSGETSTFIEKPIYNEDELQKAVDVKVDELIKEKKPKRGEFVRKERYDDKIAQILDLNSKIQQLQSEKSNLESRVSQLESEVESLKSQLQSTLQELELKDRELNNLLQQYNTLLADLQNSILKGTKEAVERASLSAQVRGLQAQKETLSAQLEAQRGINENLQTQITNQAAQFESLLSAQVAQTEALANQLSSAQTAAAAAQAEASRAQAESASKGRKIICNELYNQGYLPELIWDADEKFGDMMFEIDPKLVIGYQMWARKVVKFMKEKPQYTSFISFILKPWTLWMAHQMGTLPKTNWRGYLTHVIGKRFSYLVFDLFNGKEILQRYKTSIG